jgi:hypothetical protein
LYEIFNFPMIYPIHATEIDKRRAAEGMARRRIFAGTGSRIAYSPSTGWALSATPGRKWQHPWQTKLVWLAATQQWVVTVKAGFVNGRAPVVQTTVQAAQAGAQQDFGINPLSGLPYFSDPVFNQTLAAAAATSAQPKTELDIPLFYTPQLSPAWRAIGFDSAEGLVPPAFFAARGVQNPPPQPSEDDLLAGATPNLDQPPLPGNRLLRACDIVLHQPRSALSSNVTLQPAVGLATGLSAVVQTLTLIPADPTDRLKVYTATQIQNLSQAAIDPTTGDYTEPNFDEVLVATVYLLSPPNTAPYSSPDGTWTPYVAHNLFWNLNYGQPQFQLPPVDSEIGIPVFDSAGAIVINSLTSQINDAMNNALNIIVAASMAGSFWTPTAGGSSATFPSVTTSPAGAASGAGLDKNGIALAQRQQAALAQVSAQLDPPFPYNSPIFNLALLT